MSEVPPPAKKSRFVPPPAVPNESTAADLRVVHQRIGLSFVYSPAPKPHWFIQGATTLYVINEATSAASSPKTGNNIALHLRRTCRVSSLLVETVGPTAVDSSLPALIPVPASHQFLDPLANVLLKPPESYSVEDDVVNIIHERFAADAQCSRGASGMMTGLRVASIASNMGELRISMAPMKSTGSAASKTEATSCWSEDLYSHHSDSDGIAVHDLEAQLWERSSEARKNRIDLISSLLGEAANRAFKITTNYNIPVFDPISHLGGIHIHATPATPYIYTTVGITGDHEGPRNWVPCLDSASVRHRSTFQIAIKVTAPFREGLSAIGCGQDFGVCNTFLHDAEFDQDLASRTLGKVHLQWAKSSLTREDQKGPHVIPPDRPFVTSIDSVLATHVWCTNSWTPAPARSLGFAVGPFKVVEDPEYFSVEEDEEDEEEEEAPEGLEEEEKLDDPDDLEDLDDARSNGEGIRQAYFAPLFQRKLLHERADLSLLGGINIALHPLTSSQLEESEALDLAVTTATVGVPHRALSLLRDILALPTYRTASYTQIWIPDAVHGGGSSGALHCCPEVLVNPFLGGAILDSRLLPPPRSRLPYHAGGRVLQFLQARCAVRGWITAALPLGGHDDVGYGYIHSVIESCLMSLYERGHGAYGEGGAKGSVFFSKRYAVSSGLNSRNLDFLPVVNIDESEFDMIGGIVGALPTEDRNNDQLFRTASNGTESHSSALDEYAIRQVLIGDIVENLERGTDKDKNVPLPSFGWTGSHLSLSFLSSTASSSSELGCGAVELAHPVGGLLYRTVKSDVFRKITEGRAGIANLIRVVRAGFIAAHLGDVGETKLRWGDKKQRKSNDGSERNDETESNTAARPPFVICVDKLLSKGGFTHTLFTSGIRILSGPIREAHLRGSLVDVERNVRHPSTNRQFVDPEGYPNSFVRGASMPYLRVGAHVETAGGDAGGVGGPVTKGIQLHIMAEPAVPDGGISHCGPVTLRVVENEGQLREYVKVLNNGARADWGPIFLHAKPVTTAKDQSNASGIIEVSSGTKEKKEKSGDKANDKEAHSDKSVLANVVGGQVFNESILHGDGFQAIELVRLTNRTPLLWIRVDPQGLYGGKISCFQPDACLAEMLFHDGDAAAQVEAIRALAERPLRIQGSMKITTVHNAQVSELPARLLGDCLRGSPALHGDLPHTPPVRVQAALGLGQWQNNKAPHSKDSVDTEAWLGVNILMQYFKERFYKSGMIMPVKFCRLVIKKNEGESGKNSDGGGATSKERESDDYVYLDAISDHQKRILLSRGEDIDCEEDEEHRVRSAVISALASVRAQDGMTPSSVMKFLAAVLDAGDISMVGAADLLDAATVEIRRPSKDDRSADAGRDAVIETKMNTVARLQYVPSMVIADALLALCSVNTIPSIILDPTTGKPVHAKLQHPIEPLLLASRRWLEWELYRETIRTEMDRESQSGVGGNCYDSVAACGVAALSTLAILRQVTTDQQLHENDQHATPEVVTGAKFYMNIFLEEPRRPDVTRAACAQAVACVCCAADRFENAAPPVGLLTALEFILENITDRHNSVGLRQTLALLMLDACTGKVSSMQRVAVIGAKSDLCTSGARFYGGPLGASNGSDNGSALLVNVNPTSSPVASAVNDGARRGLRLLGRAGHPRDEAKDELVVRVAKFATDLWRTINGHVVSSSIDYETAVVRDGVCANDGILRCTLLALWQWIWPKACYAIMRVQSWRTHSDTPRYKALGADRVLKVLDEETDAATIEEKLFEPVTKIVNLELDRQTWRGEMVTKAYEHTMEKKGGNKEDNAIGDLLPPILRDNAFKQGGWVTSTSRQRRAMQLDGGIAVTKLQIRVKGSD
ncbi:hypothetical protein MHU86_5906 [Fragilaria crotonensis]|nr:hypothetical protein MHU86_5906 [Fragilaria crotonensis]